METYYTDKYDAIKNYGGLTAKSFESMNNIQEQGSQEITEFFDELRRDAIVGREQIQQMSEAFMGASSVLKETMARLKETMAQIATLNKTVTTLTNTNKQLTESNKQLANALKSLGGKKGETSGDDKKSDGTRRAPQHWHACNICGEKHRKPFKTYCLEIEANAKLRGPDWKSKL
jgi:DNA repair exonuclease SbcCD ATPase subunit